MKSLLSLVPLFELIAVGSIVVSCSNSEARFAKEIPGTWQGTPETFSDNSAITATIIDTYEFLPAAMTANETLSGTVTVTGMVNTTTQIVGDSALIEPLGLSASARTSISGTWTVIDDDEIALSFDPQSLVVEVDPDAVVANNNPIALSSPTVDSIRPDLCKTIEHGIRVALTARYASMRHMDDVKIKGALLKYEYDNEDFVLTKQTE
ncbi:MAG: hypothetical protein K2F66_01260 [Duncaniella sp.]|nr:hypothetical protein [Duncaniella sp.]